jgi:hypothetical protein
MKSAKIRIGMRAWKKGKFQQARWWPTHACFGRCRAFVLLVPSNEHLRMRHGLVRMIVLFGVRAVPSIIVHTRTGAVVVIVVCD